MCSRSESVIPCITYVMIWVSLYTIAIYARCMCRRGIILMLRQESSLNDDPSFMAHEPKWCLSDSIKGLDKHQNSERQTHHRGGRLSGTNIFLPLPACVLLGNIYYFTSFENTIICRKADISPKILHQRALQHQTNFNNFIFCSVMLGVCLRVPKSQFRCLNWLRRVKKWLPQWHFKLNYSPCCFQRG